MTVWNIKIMMENNWESKSCLEINEPLEEQKLRFKRKEEKNKDNSQ